ncbi:MAG: GGDEF domain-containing protein [Desulfobacteraceae bacterium]|nr:MAG: GGDEF domain-containing protein [Desulfobacteraceae bacterium]
MNNNTETRLPETLLHRLQKNEEILKKFHEIEISILSILNFKDFFEKLLTEISHKFGVPHTWLSIIDSSRISSQLRSITDSDLLKSSISFISENDFKHLCPDRSEPLLANTDMTRYRLLTPPDTAYDIGSIAITPITLDGEMIGSINQADRDVYRFEPGIDTSNLAHLGIKVSLCLSNVCAHEQLKFMAFHDPLTKLLNRRVMERILDREYQRSERYQTDLTVILIDLDDFKQINDTYGHDQGDRALIHVATILMELKRDSDVVARFAGDEFVVILPSTGSDQAISMMTRVQKALKDQPLSTEDGLFTVRFSFGAASAGDKNIGAATDLLKAADKVLYAAKQHKSNC